MGNITLNKSQIESVISNIKSLSMDLNEELSTICNSVDKVKGVWTDNLKAYDRLTSILSSVRNINRGYLELSDDYVNALQEAVNNYEATDKDVGFKVATASAATMTLGASAFNNFDFSKVSDTSKKAASGDFLVKGEFRDDVFTDGEYTINYLDNGTARIDKDGVPLVFTTKDNADKLASGSNATSNNISKSSAEQLVVGTAQDGKDVASVNDIGNELNAEAMAKFASSGDAIANNQLRAESSGNKNVIPSESVVIPDELYTYDANGKVSLTGLHPYVEQKKNELIEACAKQGLDIKVTADVRSVAEQNALYAQGRTAPGGVVTNAKGSTYSSNHQWGIAFDVCMNGKTTAEMYDVEKLKQVGEIGKSIGLEWGGDWKSFTDMPHFQLPDYGSGTREIKAQYGTPDKFADTWYQDK